MARSEFPRYKNLQVAMAVGRKIRSNRLLQNSFRLLSGNLIAQALTLAALPLITRIYEPEEYGNFAYFLIASGVVSSVSVLALPSSIIRSGSLGRAGKIFTICMSLIILIHVILLLGAYTASQYLNLDFIDIILIISGSFLSALLTTSQALSNHRKSYNQLSRQVVIRAVSYASLALLLPSLGLDANGRVLFSSYMISYVFSIIYLNLSLKLFAEIKLLSVRRVRAVIMKEKDVVSYMLPASWIDIISERVVAFKLQAVGMGVALGNFHLAQRTLSMPATVFGSAIARVFTPELVKRVNGEGGAIKWFVIKVWLCLAAIGLIPLLVTVTFSPQIFAFAFGPKWMFAGELARVMAFGYYAKFVSTPTSSIYLVTRNLDQSLYLIIFTALSRIIGALAGFSVSSAYGAVLGYTIGNIMSIILYNWIGLKGLANK